MKRVARRVVVLTWDQRLNESWWLPSVYFPALTRIDRSRAVSPDAIASVLGPVEVQVVPVPHDCTDGFDLAFWNRPEAYLNPEIRNGMSNFALLDADVLEEGLRHLRRDLDDGTWHRTWGHLSSETELDLGLRLVTYDWRDT
jgi:hypothetical protein